MLMLDYSNVSRNMAGLRGERSFGHTETQGQHRGDYKVGLEGLNTMYIMLDPVSRVQTIGGLLESD